MEMKLDYIFVDEVSMLHSNFYKILMIIKNLKNCKLIISGDFNQLDVINDLQKYNYKDASILKNYVIIILLNYQNADVRTILYLI